MSDNTAEFESIAPQFVVPNVVRTAEWYRDNLGFELLGYFWDPPVYAIVGRGGVKIHFGKGDSDATATNVSIRRGSLDAYVLVSNIQELYDEFISKGIKVPYPPTRRIYDRTEIEIVDCDGHTLVFGN